MLQIFTIIAVVGLIAAFVWGWRTLRGPSVSCSWVGHHDHRLARPDHELGAIRGVQPAAVALAGVLAAGFALADDRALRRHRLCDVSARPVLPGDLDPAKIQARRPVDSFVWRHPLISLGVLILVFGFIIDMILEVTLVRTGMYIYSQVIPFGSIFVGTRAPVPAAVGIRVGHAR